MKYWKYIGVLIIAFCLVSFNVWPIHNAKRILGTWHLNQLDANVNLSFYHDGQFQHDYIQNADTTIIRGSYRLKYSHLTFYHWEGGVYWKTVIKTLTPNRLVLKDRERKRIMKYDRIK